MDVLSGISDGESVMGGRIYLVWTSCVVYLTGTYVVYVCYFTSGGDV